MLSGARRQRFLLSGLLALLLAPLAAGGRHTARAGGGPFYLWSELGPGGALQARLITTDSDCPTILIDGAAQPMQTRVEPSTAFPVRVCQAVVPAGTRSAAVDGRALALPPAEPSHLVVLGDTGCRIADEGGSVKTQACNDATAWPAAQVAADAAAQRPDLIIHVGDYHYREAPCPDGNAGCAGSPWGDTWASWEADFFAPFATLLPVAPWVLVRGNHEVCERAGEGWFRFLDPGPLPARCADFSDPYTVQVGGLQLLMLDSANADDIHESPQQVAIYRQQFETLRRLAGPNAWLLTHRPLWAFGHLGEQNGSETLFRDNPNLQAASGNVLPGGVRLVLSGHIHLFEWLRFAGPRPPQVVAGNGGTLLDPPITTPLSGLQIAGLPVVAGTDWDAFGFLTLDAAGSDWLLTPYDAAGQPVSPACSIDAACEP